MPHWTCCPGQVVRFRDVPTRESLRPAAPPPLSALPVRVFEPLGNVAGIEPRRGEAEEIQPEHLGSETTARAGRHSGTRWYFPSPKPPGPQSTSPSCVPPLSHSEFWILAARFFPLATGFLPSSQAPSTPPAAPRSSIASTPCSSASVRWIRLATSTRFSARARMASRKGPQRLPTTLISSMTSGARFSGLPCGDGALEDDRAARADHLHRQLEPGGAAGAVDDHVLVVPRDDVGEQAVADRPLLAQASLSGCLPITRTGQPAFAQDLRDEQARAGRRPGR